MRLSYFPLPSTFFANGVIPPNLSAATKSAITSTLSRRAIRGSSSLLPLDLTLLQSPPVLAGWNALLGALRDDAVLPEEIRELVMCRVAVLNGSVFEWSQHAPLLRSALMTVYVGDTEKVEDAMKAVLEARNGAFCGSGTQEDVVLRSSLDEKYLAVLAYTDAMTNTVEVSQDVWNQVRGFISNDREMVELTTTCAVYNCVSRFLVALDVGEVGQWSIKKATLSEGRLDSASGIHKSKL